MPTFAGINHCSLTVTDLDASQRFYTEVFDFLPVLDFGVGRVLLHTPTGFTIGLVRHEGATGGRFTELTTGLDHLGLTASSRDELVRWQERLERAGVEYTPIRDMELGHHLNLRDPDGIALELFAPNEVYSAALADAASRDLTPAELAEAASRLIGGEDVVGVGARSPDDQV